VGVSTVEVLTEAMTRLRDEIVSLRRARVAWRDDLVRRVSALRADFASDRAGAHRAWFGRSGPPPLAARPPQRELRVDAEPEPKAAAAPLPEPQRAAPFKPAASLKAKTHKKH